MASPIRVAIVDDSALVRSVLSAIVGSAPDMTVVGTAADPYQARELIRATSPDVITLDVEMPRMDGLDFLEKLMRLRPMPVVMVSTLTERGTETTLRALELGAVDFVAKPRIGVASGLQEAGAELLEKLRIAARARVLRRPAEPAPAPGRPATPAAGGAVPSRPATAPMSRPRGLGTEKIIAIGASTGGTEAVRVVLAALPPDAPAVVVTQHMPPGFTRSFAERLDGVCRVRVAEAADGARLLPGHAYIAPGGRHLAVVRSGADYLASIGDAEPVNRHRPSVEVLFDSVARVVGPNAIGVMLTGMGRDGADAMRRMREAGAHNLAQDEATCVVYGMPREAVLAGAVHESLPLGRIAERILALLAAGGVRHRV